MVRVAAVQFATGADVQANLATVLRMLDRARGAELVVLPEFCNHPSWYDDDAHAWDVALDLDGPFVKAVGEKAAALGAWVMLNATVRRTPGRVTDTNVLLDSSGAVASTSDKQVLMGGERLHIAEGDEASPIIDSPFGRLGLYSCMDGVIFETPRMLAVRGAQILLNSLNSFALDEASLHVPVRAAENKVFVVAANKVGALLPDAVRESVAGQLGIDPTWLEGAGESQVVAPDGTVLAIAPRRGEAVIFAEIDALAADDKRRPDGTDVMAARRPSAYGPIAQEPRGVSRVPGPEVVDVAVTSGLEHLAEALATGASLVVLPELPQTPGGRTDDPAALADSADAHLEALTAVAGDAVVVTSVVRRVGGGFAHVAVAVTGQGVLAEQTALHASARHLWATVLADEVGVVASPVGRLALLVGDDGIYPEAARLCALVEAEVVALPFTVLEAWELRTGLVERAAENRLNVVAAAREGRVILAAQKDFTLWTPWERPFDGTINYPVVTTSAAAVVLAPVHPAATANRFVSRGTDVVDGRPWRLASALTDR